jgi:hypothetical protein
MEAEVGMSRLSGLWVIGLGVWLLAAGCSNSAVG